ncbi:dihydroorotate dehydrogenase [Microdochium nivale]|nr:dihydroorotate dehydrogenase [Microdochium nivale]
MASTARLAGRLVATSTATARPRATLLANSRPVYRHSLQLLPRTARRHASSSSSPASTSVSNLKIALWSTSITLSGYAVYLYATDTRSFIHRYVVPPVLRIAIPDAEDAHHVAVSALGTLYSLGLNPRERSRSADGPALSVSVFGEDLCNPIGISAGLDKHAEIPDALFALGAGVVEVGGCTPLAQPGNPKPRMFRVPGLDGLINRYGLNSHGADHMAMKLRERVRLYAKSVGLDEDGVLNGEANVPPGSLLPGRLLLVQIAKNKDTDGGNVDAVSRDYVYCVERLAKYADVLVVNVSSPNTPGLRDLQAVEPLSKILTAVVDEARRANRKTKPKVMVKVSPDEDDESQMRGIVQAIYSSGVDGVIVGNTTRDRLGVIPPGVKLDSRDTKAMAEVGGYSGPMMFNRTLDLVGRYRKMLDNYSRQARQKETLDKEAVDASLAGIDGSVTGMVEDAALTHKGKQTQGPKVIFATGGITNGDQALRILNAGASVAMIYTSLVYGGSGTVTRIKSQMKEEIGSKEK